MLKIGATRCGKREQRCTRTGQSRDAARALWIDCFRHGRLPGELASAIHIKSVESPDGTTKFLIRLPDNHETESVILPLTGKGGRVRNTLCLSSQVGTRKYWAPELYDRKCSLKGGVLLR